MPDRNLDDDGFVIDHGPAHLTQAAIDNCTLCDSDGYRGTQVCDHIDRTVTNARGSAACRAALTKDGDHQ
ncbi:hypothetical protein A5637_13260 [Mycolicibacterium fortuitum]|uniref:hypothetical protein n=1 Tax=Mycolicibacterium fortuitum TaxID=1766 RepID=UPI0007ECAACE|nr:hypothetical protein [Mycolicibacterium fortuitum]OBK04044.1 hypothetical protein A5637_13260 [Mycolicibacterium fortuitum]